MRSNDMNSLGFGVFIHYRSVCDIIPHECRMRESFFGNEELCVDSIDTDKTKKQAIVFI